MVVLSTEGAQAMVFPTAETLPELKSLAGKVQEERGSRFGELSSPNQLLPALELVSPIGPLKKKNEEFLAQFELVYWLSEQRIQGETVRLLVCQQPWQLFVLTEMTADSVPEWQTFDERPSYQELEKLFMSRGGSVAAWSVIDRGSGRRSSTRRLFRPSLTTSTWFNAR